MVVQVSRAAVDREAVPVNREAVPVNREAVPVNREPVPVVVLANLARAVHPAWVSLVQAAALASPSTIGDMVEVAQAEAWAPALLLVRVQAQALLSFKPGDGEPGSGRALHLRVTEAVTDTATGLRTHLFVRPGSYLNVRSCCFVELTIQVVLSALDNYSSCLTRSPPPLHDDLAPL